MEPREEAVEKQFKTVMAMAAIQTRESEDIETSLADLKSEIDSLEDKQIKVRKERQFLAERAFRLEGALQNAFLVRLEEKTTELGSASKELHAKVKEIVERYTSPMIAISRLRRDADMLLAELPPLSADRLQNEWREQLDAAEDALSDLRACSVHYRTWLQECETNLNIDVYLPLLLRDVLEGENLDNCLQMYERVAKAIFSLTEGKYKLITRSGASAELVETFGQVVETVIGELNKTRREKLDELMQGDTGDEPYATLDSAVENLDALVRYQKQLASVSKNPEAASDVCAKEIDLLEARAIRYQIRALGAKAAEAVEVSQDEDIRGRLRGISESVSAMSPAITACFGVSDASDRGLQQKVGETPRATEEEQASLQEEERFVIGDVLGNALTNIAQQCDLLRRKDPDSVAQSGLLERMIDDAEKLAGRTRWMSQSADSSQTPDPRGYAAILRKFELIDVFRERASSGSSVSDAINAHLDVLQLERVEDLHDRLKKCEEELVDAERNADLFLKSVALHRLYPPQQVANLILQAAYKNELIAVVYENIKTAKVESGEERPGGSVVRAASYHTRQRKYEDKAKYYRGKSEECRVRRAVDNFFEKPDDETFKDVPDTAIIEVREKVLPHKMPLLEREGIMKGVERVDESGETIRDHCAEFVLTFMNKQKIGHHGHFAIPSNSSIPMDSLITDYKGSCEVAFFEYEEDLGKGLDYSTFHGKSSFESTLRIYGIARELNRKRSQSLGPNRTGGKGR